MSGVTHRVIIHKKKKKKKKKYKARQCSSFCSNSSLILPCADLDCGLWTQMLYALALPSGEEFYQIFIITHHFFIDITVCSSSAVCGKVIIE